MSDGWLFQERMRFTGSTTVGPVTTTARLSPPRRSRVNRPRPTSSLPRWGQRRRSTCWSGWSPPPPPSPSSRWSSGWTRPRLAGRTWPPRWRRWPLRATRGVSAWRTSSRPPGTWPGSEPRTATASAPSVTTSSSRHSPTRRYKLIRNTRNLFPLPAVSSSLSGWAFSASSCSCWDNMAGRDLSSLLSHLSSLTRNVAIRQNSSCLHFRWFTHWRSHSNGSLQLKHMKLHQQTGDHRVSVVNSYICYLSHTQWKYESDLGPHQPTKLPSSVTKTVSVYFIVLNVKTFNANKSSPEDSKLEIRKRAVSGLFFLHY